MKVIERQVSELIEAEYNPRKLTDRQHDALTDSLKRFGMVDPVIVNMHADRKNIIVGGHQRYRIWRELGNETIPTVEVKLDRDRERELNVRLNRNTGEWDWDALATEFDMPELTEWGFDADEIAGLFAEADIRDGGIEKKSPMVEFRVFVENEGAATFRGELAKLVESAGGYIL